MSDNASFFCNQLTEFILLHVLAFFEGILVTKFNWRVNYTRKINHFFVFFSPYLIELVFPFQGSFARQITVAVVGLSTLAIYLKPVRENIKIVKLMFCAFDRPEDRPHTLRWLFTQYLATYLVALPLWLVFDYIGHKECIPIIILINAIGDGLAEPVGITWGKHKYKVRAIFTSNLYTRSLEGSACVFITAVCVILGFHSYFTLTQFIFALAIVPAVSTLAEAKSPHTWDSPFIFLFTGLALIFVFWI